MTTEQIIMLILAIVYGGPFYLVAGYIVFLGARRTIGMQELEPWDQPNKQDFLIAWFVFLLWPVYLAGRMLWLILGSPRRFFLHWKSLDDQRNPDYRSKIKSPPEFRKGPSY